MVDSRWPLLGSMEDVDLRCYLTSKVTVSFVAGNSTHYLELFMKTSIIE